MYNFIKIMNKENIKNQHLVIFEVNKTDSVLNYIDDLKRPGILSTNLTK